MEASFTVAVLLLLAAATVFWVWALVDVLRRPGAAYRSGSQLLWALVIALTHSVGAVAYVLFGRPRAAATETVGR
ncbi:MAG TPA: PLD nuclease N-terminal domain-containing protein [Acidimicrobiales bacterium]|nr:PLD nuclease N-terminal domain-containing protein [Acidimicrobiales bacterium]